MFSLGTRPDSKSRGEKRWACGSYVLPCIPEGPEKDPFLVTEWKGVLDLRKPGSERRLEEALRGPGAGMELPRKEKLPPELMEAARRL
ncbi:hypothetical protein EYF80_019731 [Liparis tanakae]|uniref:Uncharacterized protein n=1 Tax=Liparis tanakae TaxID=230148 RepID=A0A4Z2HXJ4_9TELE|nr:hypothetical protein EYF80_019731 [Liparis tanakae]